MANMAKNKFTDEDVRKFCRAVIKQDGDEGLRPPEILEDEGGTGVLTVQYPFAILPTD